MYVCMQRFMYTVDVQKTFFLFASGLNNNKKIHINDNFFSSFKIKTYEQPGMNWLPKKSHNHVEADNKIRPICLFSQCQHSGQGLHFRLKLIFNSARLPQCDDITTLSLFLPYLCLSSGGPEDYICPVAPRQARTDKHTLSEGSAEVHVLYNLQEVIRGIPDQRFCTTGKHSSLHSSSGIKGRTAY